MSRSAKAALRDAAGYLAQVVGADPQALAQFDAMIDGAASQSEFAAHLDFCARRVLLPAFCTFCQQDVMQSRDPRAQIDRSGVLALACDCGNHIHTTIRARTWLELRVLLGTWLCAPGQLPTLPGPVERMPPAASPVGELVRAALDARLNRVAELFPRLRRWAAEPDVPRARGLVDDIVCANFCGACGGACRPDALARSIVCAAGCDFSTCSWCLWFQAFGRAAGTLQHECELETWTDDARGMFVAVRARMFVRGFQAAAAPKPAEFRGLLPSLGPRTRRLHGGEAETRQTAS